jgi:hypothetical protein
MEINVPANTYDLWMGDPVTQHWTKMFDDYVFRSTQTQVDRIRFFGAKSGQTDWTLGYTGVDNIYISDVPCPNIPEPSSLLALATGLIGLAGVAIRRRS